LLALGFAAAFERTHGIAWVTPVIALWTIVAPWAVSALTMRPAGVRARAYPARRRALTTP